MQHNVYLAFYQGKGNWKDALIRFFTKGKFSHCEIVVERQENWGQYDYRPVYDCYSSSPRDNGVRMKTVQRLNPEHWVLVPVEMSETLIKAYFEQTNGKRYDWRGVLGLLFGIKQRKDKFFCSEWCFNVIFNTDEGWRFNPNQLAAIFEPKEK